MHLERFLLRPKRCMKQDPAPAAIPICNLTLHPHSLQLQHAAFGGSIYVINVVGTSIGQRARRAHKKYMLCLSCTLGKGQNALAQICSSTARQRTDGVLLHHTPDEQQVHRKTAQGARHATHPRYGQPAVGVYIIQPCSQAEDYLAGPTLIINTSSALLLPLMSATFDRRRVRLAGSETAGTRLWSFFVMSVGI